MFRMKIAEEFSSVRTVTILTPDTFTRKMIIVSTTFRFSDNVGQTAIKQQAGLNYFHVDIGKGDWHVLKEHIDYEQAMRYHNQIVRSKKFTDCELIKSQGLEAYR